MGGVIEDTLEVLTTKGLLLGMRVVLSVMTNHHPPHEARTHYVLCGLEGEAYFFHVLRCEEKNLKFNHVGDNPAELLRRGIRALEEGYPTWEEFKPR